MLVGEVQHYSLKLKATDPAAVFDVLAGLKKNVQNKQRIQQYRHIAFSTDNNRELFTGDVKSDGYDLLLPWFLTHGVTEVWYP